MGYEILNRRMRSRLLRQKILDEKQVDTVFALCERENKSLTTALLENHALHEPQLLSLLAQEANIPPIDLTKIDLDKNTLNVINPDWAKAFHVLPLSRLGKILTVATSNPFDVNLIDNLRILTGCDIRFVVATDAAIQKALTQATSPAPPEIENTFIEADLSDIKVGQGAEQEEEEIDLSVITGEAEDSPVIKMVNSILLKALNEGTSDIHIEPFEHRTRVRFRVDGALREITTLPRKIHNTIVSRIKILCGLDIAERRIPQDGKFQIHFESRPIDFRTSILPSVYGEKVVLRILDSSNITMANIDQLGFEPEILTLFRKAIGAPWGMILVTGPTGSGKSTTLYSAIKEIMCIEDNIVTVEDPVEYQLDGITQVPINVKRGLTFAGALRSILRQDPDTVLLGEIRDQETADIAVKAALTGHLVLSTLHTNDAPSTITRLIDMGIDPFLVSSSLIMVCAQRLARKLCEACKEPHPISKERLLGIGFKPEECEQSLYRAVGCARCSNGYKGRFALLEALDVDDAVRRLILQEKSAMDIKESAVREKGMLTLRRVGILNALRGRTSVEEILRSTADD